MSMNEIQDAARGLSDQERGHLALWLLDSLPPSDGDDAISESIEEAARRRDEIDSGKTVPVDSASFWESVQRERSAWK